MHHLIDSVFLFYILLFFIFQDDEISFDDQIDNSFNFITVFTFTLLMLFDQIFDNIFGVLKEKFGSFINLTINGPEPKFKEIFTNKKSKGSLCSFYIHDQQIIDEGEYILTAQVLEGNITEKWFYNDCSKNLLKEICDICC